jgi:hypothetical protein
VEHKLGITEKTYECLPVITTGILERISVLGAVIEFLIVIAPMVDKYK